MNDLTQLVGATVISGFIGLSTLAMFLYLRRRVALDHRSPTNHAIVARFDSVEELREFHAQEHAAVHAGADAALARFQRAVSAKKATMDPKRAELYPQPTRCFCELIGGQS